MRIYILFGPLR